MMRKAIGFYWTLPVPWAQFNAVDPHDIDKAAAQSRTIAMQRRIVRDYAQREFEILEESAHIELAPDRGTEEFVSGLTKLIERARALEATILLVDFGAATHQRTHQHLQKLLDQNADLFLPIWPGDDQTQGLVAHFGQWRERQTEWTSGKSARVAKALARAEQLLGQGATLGKAALALETEGLRSATGKPWTAAGLRQAIKAKT
ncbi:hypothetical protein [Novosphingobium aquimarinum]|uniref:hypothetical protein n=1 Tax=Novosphingobium aquimarinum TaxID=2682494 RepID=UPI0012EB830C|nr:hypothetical protein [Novosphingobium aquimarinum]